MSNRRGILAQIDRWDPIAFIFLAHGLGLALAGATERPLLISILTGGLALIRLTAAWLSSRPSIRLAAAGASVLLAYAVIVADGGLESPFFFWILVLLGWQAVSYRRDDFIRLGGLAVLAYLPTLAVTRDLTVASLARLGLLAAFIFSLAVGRTMLDRQESEVRRLDDVVSTLIQDAGMAVAVLDADRETVLYANSAAREMGLTSREAMARLILDDPSRLPQVTTLIDLLDSAGSLPSPLHRFRSIGSDGTGFSIGYHPRRLEDGPVVLVYGAETGTDAPSPA